MVKEKRILSNYIGWLILGLFICFVGINNTYASEISGFDFMGKDFNSFWIEQNSSTSGTLSVTVSDITQIKPYINIIMATTYEPNFVVTSNNYFTDTWTRKLYSYGTTTVSDYTANVYVIQFSTKGLNNWNCSVDGTNCYVSTNIRMTGPSDYSAVFQLRSISLTDSVLDDDYLKNITVNQNNEIIDQNQTMIDQNQTIIQGQDKLEDAIIDSNNKTQDVIKDQFNSCYKNVLNNFTFETQTKNGITITNNGDNTITINGTSTGYTAFQIQNLTLIPDSYYTLSGGINSNQVIQIIEGKDNPLTNENGYVTWYNKGTSGTLYIVILGRTTINNAIMKPMLTNDNILHEYVPPQQEKCTNKLDEQNETQKGIWATIKNLPNAFMDMLKGLFIPEDGYFEDWFNTIKVFFEDKLGFLATPFTIIIDFINRYLSLNPQEDIIINIPDITVPNFEDHIIVKATTFNWSQLLKSKESLNTLWQLYLSFVDVFLILNFINLCENKYNRIFGGDTTQYEYYTVEDSYNVDVKTGEIKSQRRNERTTTRKKVN